MAELHKAIARLMKERCEEFPGDAAAPAQFLGYLREHLSPEEQPLAQAFADELFAAASQEGQLPLHLLAELAAEGFRFLRDRGNRPIALRVRQQPQDGAGGTPPLTLVEAALEDSPFIVDTLHDTLQHQGGEIRLLLHSVMGVERGHDGALQQIGPPDCLATRESFVHAEVANLAPSAQLEELLHRHLRQVLWVTEDHRAIRARVGALTAELHTGQLPAPWGEDREEIGAFLEWLDRDNFVYLGYREYDLLQGGDAQQAVVRAGTGLGILRRDEDSRYRRPQALSEAQRRRIDGPPLLLLSKTNALGPVHRIAPMDDLGLKRVDVRGTVSGVHRLLGLLTTKAYDEPSSEIPILRRQIQDILAAEGAVEGTCDYGDLVALFNSVPKEELFASRVDDTRQLLRSIVGSPAGTGIRALCRPDALRRGLLVTVLLPRARYSTEIHQRVSDVLREQLRAAVLHEHVALDERPVARLHYYLAADAAVLRAPPAEALEGALNELLRTWEGDLRKRLALEYAPATAEQLASKYAAALPSAYKAGTDAVQAARDIRRFEALASDGEEQIELGELPRRGSSTLLALKLYVAAPLGLSDFISVLDNLGLRVLEQDAIDVILPEVGGACLHTFSVQADTAPGIHTARAVPLVVPALRALRSGAVENDRLNCLTLRAQLYWRAVDVLRTYVEHAVQTGVASRATLVGALNAHPNCARRLFHFFAAKFDPQLDFAERQGAVEEAEQDFSVSLEQVESLARDRLLRCLGAAVAATVRTNFFLPRERRDGAAPVAIKLDCSRLAHLPGPRPMFETYVHSPHMEGTHLRAGRVARGGIRLCDRPDEFRAEVLGRMRTQQVKNAVVVPVGAQGGFIVKECAPGTPAEAARVERAYRTLISALLSITDNVEGDRVVTPRGQIVYDQIDPYLVVAAGQGTEAFSDIANSIAAQHRFWLGDAFAAGGTGGYDHRNLAITARGAWECARQHFHDMGRELERESVSVIGIGDVSGDVFGNGLLRSSALRLLAAFDDRHIFLDPDPNPEQSFLERQRLFHLPRGQWNDYSPTSISPGGGVFPRNAKVVELSPEARARLGVEATQLPGTEVIRAILRMEVDLLWSAGAGTYVKATDELHGEVGDPANDDMRIDATELRVRVVAEGGDAGLTQRARIEFALAGGRINTNAIDRSAGIALSDCEVNMKIALAPATACGTLTPGQRDQLLADVADECCDTVLDNSRRQATALDLDQARSQQALPAFRDLITALETGGVLDRQLDNLPSREALRVRRSTYLGLTRPELAVLLCLTKQDLQRRILESPLCEEPHLERYLSAHFPARLRQRFSPSIHQHPVHQEIAALELANRLVDWMGSTFLFRAAGDTGCELLEVVRAWTAVLAISRGDEMLDLLDYERPRMSAEAERQCRFAVEDALARGAMWLVETQPPQASLGELIQRFGEPTGELLAAWPELLTGRRRSAHDAEVVRLARLGLQAETAERLARLAAVEDALEISDIAMSLDDVALPKVAEAHLRTEQLVDLDWMRRALPCAVAGEGRWQRRALAGLLAELMCAHRQLTADVLGCQPAETPVGECLARYSASNAAQLARLRALVDDLRAAPEPTLAGMLVAMRELGRLGRCS